MWNLVVSSITPSVPHVPISPPTLNLLHVTESSVLPDSTSHAAHILQHLPATYGWNTSSSRRLRFSHPDWSSHRPTLPGWLYPVQLHAPAYHSTNRAAYFRDSWFGLPQLCASATFFTIYLKNLPCEHCTATVPSSISPFHSLDEHTLYHSAIPLLFSSFQN